MLNSVGQRGRQFRERQASTRVDVSSTEIIATVALHQFARRCRRRIEQAPIGRESSIRVGPVATIEDLDDGASVAHEQRVCERGAVGPDQNMSRLGHAELLAEGK